MLTGGLGGFAEQENKTMGENWYIFVVQRHTTVPCETQDIADELERGKSAFWYL